jgi:hypothetical protein
MAMTEDWFVTTVDGVVHAAREAGEALEAAIRVLEGSREARLAGTPIIELVDALVNRGGKAARLATAEAFREYERAAASWRAGLARALVDEAGLTLTDVAARFGISRQAAARLYQAGTEGPNTLPVEGTL